MPGHEHHRNAYPALLHLRLEREATFATQTHIEHQATGHGLARKGQKVLGGTKALHLQADRTEQTVKGQAHGFVVIDDIHDWLVRVVRAL